MPRWRYFQKHTHMLNRSEELEAFKTRINLTLYAASRGYAIDRKASSRNSAILQHPNGDKVIVALDHDGHWIYFSVRDDKDNGSIIDFIQRRGGGSLGDVRKELRAFGSRLRERRPFDLAVILYHQSRRDVVANLLNGHADAWQKSRPMAFRGRSSGDCL